MNIEEKIRFLNELKWESQRREKLYECMEDWYNKKSYGCKKAIEAIGKGASEYQMQMELWKKIWKLEKELYA